jgi:hypothetical protein
MTKAAVLARSAVRQTAGWLRAGVVLSCAGALIMAGEALPF